MNYPRIILAGTQSSVGKTTLALGIILALSKKGLKVQPFKAGPDYIDPTYHAQVSRNISANLDSYLMSNEAILELFKRRASRADISVIEGVMGLYDGLRGEEQGSSADLAKILKSPVILIMDVRSLSRSAAAVALGFREFDKNVNIAGIILNNIGSKNHLDYVKQAIESKTKIKVLGYLPKILDLKLPQRHLGLVPTQETKLDNTFCKQLLNLVKKYIDLDQILKISRRAGKLPLNKKQIFIPQRLKSRLTLAVPRDKVFNFYYQDNLDILKHLGAKLVEFNSLENKKLPSEISGLYIGGGFPELFAAYLSKNINLKEDIYQKFKTGLPIYAECGGLMYLVERLIDFQKKSHSMVGIFKGSVSMADKLQALGYVNVETLKDNILSKKGNQVKAHMFHWSYLKGTSKSLTLAYKLKKGPNKVFYDGLIKKNALATYTHLHFASNLNFAKNFINSCKKYKEEND